MDVVLVPEEAVDVGEVAGVAVVVVRDTTVGQLISSRRGFIDVDLHFPYEFDVNFFVGDGSVEGFEYNQLQALVSA
ncbi:hypothetical protein R1flu_004998 [Riccia fluitans]|uniref:Uncharacterized protein n=1 Tax=Riccia fluitans TaxID=41844 RepID=A0ABD1YUQ8_9MARC